MSGFKRFNWHAWAMGVVALATILIVACGGSDEPTVASVPPTTVGQPAEIAATAVPAAAATATPVSEAMTSARDTAIFVTNEEPTTLGAASANCGGNIQNTVCDDIASDPLTWIDNATFEVVPLSPIESWEQIDPSRWRFKLREGVTFHNGAPWNATQAAFWIDFFGDEETSGHSNSNDFSFHGVISGEAVDELTLDVVCGKPCPILPRTTIFTKFQDVGWFEQASEDDIERMTIGLGPYKIVEWRSGIEVELEAFADYKPNNSRDSQAPVVQHLFQQWRNEPLVRAAMIEAGEADWAEISLDDRDRVPQFQVATNNELYVYAIDTIHHPELRKVEVREALNLAIDCETLMERIFDSLLECYGNIAQPGTVGITPENSAGYPYDPDRARQLLADAGYDPANNIILHARGQRVPKDVEYAEAVVNYWGEVGITAELKIVESSIHGQIARSNCGHKRTREEFAAAPGATLEEKCASLGPGEPTFNSMHLTAPSTSTESLDFSRQGILRNSCFSRSSGVCEQELEEMIEIASATDTGPLRTERMVAIADHIHNHFHFVPNFQNVVVYGLSADLEWESYYAPRIRANTFRFK
jgi:peptide/nickel transport system substrate-binding protein